MSYPLDNLKDYSKVIDDLKNFSGDLAKLYEHVGDTAVAKKRPYIMMEGGLLVLALAGAVKTCKLGHDFYKRRKMLIKNEPFLKEEFINKMQTFRSSSFSGTVSEEESEETSLQENPTQKEV